MGSVGLGGEQLGGLPGDGELLVGRDDGDGDRHPSGEITRASRDRGLVAGRIDRQPEPVQPLDHRGPQVGLFSPTPAVKARTSSRPRMAR